VVSHGTDKEAMTRMLVCVRGSGDSGTKEEHHEDVSSNVTFRNESRAVTSRRFKEKDSLERI
jgi:hypothetical protein